jgi:hypothetical protein
VPGGIEPIKLKKNASKKFKVAIMVVELPP